MQERFKTEEFSWGTSIWIGDVIARGRFIAGIDLAATRPSTIATLSDCIEISHVEFNELMARLSHAELVAVDAPLSLPSKGAFRDFERILLKRGYRLLPLTLPSMKRLTLRGIELKRALESKGVVVLETHPTSARKALGISSEDVVSIMKRWKFRSNYPKNQDEIDALTCLLVALLYMDGKTEEFRGEDGSMVLPASGVHL